MSLLRALDAKDTNLLSVGCQLLELSIFCPYPIPKPPVLSRKKAPGEAERSYLIYFSHFFSFNSIFSFL